MLALLRRAPNDATSRWGRWSQSEDRSRTAATRIDWYDRCCRSSALPSRNEARMAQETGLWLGERDGWRLLFLRFACGYTPRARILEAPAFLSHLATRAIPHQGPAVRN